MYVPLKTLESAVRLVENLTELAEPDDFVRVALPALAEVVGCDVLTYIAVGLGPDSRSEFDRPNLGGHFPRPVPVDHQLAVTLSVPGSAAVGIAFNRAQHEFDESDRAVLAILRRPLLAALQRVRPAPAARSRTGLTARERAILRQVADGQTNRAIAHALQISPRTVAKHLEHAYRKLGVCNRAAAVSATTGRGERAGAGPADAGPGSAPSSRQQRPPPLRRRPA
jgi:DNA-binding CsgD family transcriptional regulator